MNRSIRTVVLTALVALAASALPAGAGQTAVRTSLMVPAAFKETAL